jgi:hypothetical protein
VQQGPGQRYTLNALESVQPRAGGEVLFIEGHGTSKTEQNRPGEPGHEAIAFIFYDEKSKTFRFQAHRAGGISVDCEAKVNDRGFEWGFQSPQGGTLRFKMMLTDKGEWFETGEMTPDGKTWYKFLEMTLQRVK